MPVGLLEVALAFGLYGGVAPACVEVVLVPLFTVPEAEPLALVEPVVPLTLPEADVLPVFEAEVLPVPLVAPVVLP